MKNAGFLSDLVVCVNAYLLVNATLGASDIFPGIAALALEMMKPRRGAIFIARQSPRINLVFQRHGCETRSARLAAVPLKNDKPAHVAFL